MYPDTRMTGRSTLLFTYTLPTHTVPTHRGSLPKLADEDEKSWGGLLT